MFKLYSNKSLQTCSVFAFEYTVLPILFLFHINIHLLLATHVNNCLNLKLKKIWYTFICNKTEVESIKGNFVTSVKGFTFYFEL